MAARGGRGDDGGAVSDMDSTVAQWRLRAGTTELGDGDGGARLALTGEGEAKRERESVSTVALPPLSSPTGPTSWADAGVLLPHDVRGLARSTTMAS